MHLASLGHEKAAIQGLNRSRVTETGSPVKAALPGLPWVELPGWRAGRLTMREAPGGKTKLVCWRPRGWKGGLCVPMLGCLAAGDVEPLVAQSGAPSCPGMGAQCPPSCECCQCDSGCGGGGMQICLAAPAPRGGHTPRHPLNVAMARLAHPCQGSPPGSQGCNSRLRYSVDGIPVQPGRTEGSVPALSSS